MREVQRSATVQQPPSRMYELINDIESYPHFVPGCTHARLESRTEREIVATLGVARGPLRAEFTTRNELEPDRRISMRLLRGPLRMLEGEWTLTPVGHGGCRIDLRIRFAFANRLSGILFEPLFLETAASLVDAFVARALAL
ncbi:MAG: type II toxin-antitoxin system RatA family toxin [Steroidobacteraceae bacterium]